MINWLQQNFRLNEVILNRFEKYRKSQTINGREMKKNEAFNSLLDEALNRQEFLDLGMFYSKPDMALIRDKIDLGDDLLEDEIHYIFSFLNSLAFSKKFPISINMINAIFDVGLIQAGSINLDDSNLSYMTGNVPFSLRDEVVSATQLLRKHKKFFINKNQKYFCTRDIEMNLRNPFICIRDYPITHIEAVNKYIKTNRNIFLHNLTFYSFLLNPKEAILKKNIELLSMADKELLIVKDYHFYITNRESSLGEIDLYGFFYIGNTRCAVPSYIAFQLMKFSLLGMDIYCDKVEYPDFYKFYEKDEGSISSGVFSININKSQRMEILEAIDKIEKDNIEALNILKKSYGEIL